MKEISPNIIIDPKIRFGKPVIKGTRIMIEEVLGALAGGMSFEEIEDEYGVKKRDILAVLNYVTSFFKGVEIKSLEDIAVAV